MAGLWGWQLKRPDGLKVFKTSISGTNTSLPTFMPFTDGCLKNDIKD